MSDYIRIKIEEAQSGDEMLQAGEWCVIDDAKLMQHSDMIHIRFEGGGTMSFPVSHQPATRRPVESGIRSSQLEEGDIVIAYGMRVLLDRVITRTDDGSEGGPVTSSSGRVLNVDDVQDRMIPIAWLYDHSIDRHPRWTIQGNDFARWTRELHNFAERG